MESFGLALADTKLGFYLSLVPHLLKTLICFPAEWRFSKHKPDGARIGRESLLLPAYAEYHREQNVAFEEKAELCYVQGASHTFQNSEEVRTLISLLNHHIPS